MNVLIVDDYYSVLDSTKKYLEHYNFCVFTAETVHEAMKLLNKFKIDLVVLDVMLTEENGFDFCKTLKSQSNIPVIFISSLSSEDNRINGLLCGGDDYLVKPFSFEELRLRILKRIGEKSDGNKYNLNGIIIENFELVSNGVRVPLTPREVEILLLLWNGRGNYFQPEEIYERIWGMPENGDVRTVKYHMHNLKKKIMLSYPDKTCIKTKRGHGYAFV